MMNKRKMVIDGKTQKCATDLFFKYPRLMAKSTRKHSYRNLLVIL